MKLRRSRAALAMGAAAAVLAGLGLSASTASAASTMTVTGTVVNNQGFPLPGVSVSVVSQGNDETIASRTTDSAGTYTAKVTVPAKDKFVLVAEDRTGRHLRKAIGPYRPAPGTTVRKNLVMSPGGVIQGKVTDASGAPIPLDRTGSIEIYVEGEGTVNLSTKSSFRIGALPPGEHALTISDSKKRYAPLCYDQVPMNPDDSCAGNVTLIEVTAGGVTTINPQRLTAR